MDGATFQDELVRLRRALHREPELGLELPRTQKRVLDALDGLPLEITTGKSLSSVTAVLHGRSPGPAVLLRADMDALPLDEQSGVAYASLLPGRMHACGHDLHAAMLVGAARLLAGKDFAGSVIFMFQPGEEGCGGAKHMIDEGVLEAAGQPPVAAYGLHVAASQLPSGWFMTRRGPMMAAVDEVHVTVRGAGGHGSQPHLARDPIPPTCEMVTALQTFAARAFDAFDPIVLSVGSLHAGSKANTLPAEAYFEFTIRSMSPTAQTRAREGVARVLSGIASAHGLTVDVDFDSSHPVMVNDSGEADHAADTVSRVFGADRFVWAPTPLAASEDFAYVLDRVPGALVFLGACPPDRDLLAAPFNHAADAAFDDAVLTDGAVLLSELALRRLAASQTRPDFGRAAT
jgi:hippurate hydrolase